MADWLVKSEPTVYSIDDLARDRIEIWDGVRNYQARNFLRQMQEGDRVFIYHSNAKPPGLAGLAEVVAANVIDPTQFDPHSPYYDPKATPDKPRWYTVKLGYVATFADLVPLDTLKATFTPDEFVLVRRGNRLSVMPVEGAIASRLLALTTLRKET
ncbi:EVE domain-containing protein [Spirulina major CS-329]|uniref:EVE domain-containing protein n=1 Tax=Spirulina TaxID=1154 RepID=UPI00232ADAFD|nr:MULTISPECIES: EVE domain-containing protein [Spirulina]MDB9495071.1 EVE domain-containing protein [Spirulina subsalsa CS-330]MDB9504233.1 EVE domain-containing protein [Spirulina major CS-329]